MKMGVSCLCLTYARWNTLEEAVYSFLAQTYEGPRELLILNDCPEQQIVCKEPNVVVVNLPIRCNSLGEKYNLAVALAQYERLMIWEDDDIYLPRRIDQTMRIMDEKKLQYYKETQAFFYDTDRMQKIVTGLHFSAGCWTRSLLHAAGYFRRTWANTDQDVEGRLKHVCPPEAYLSECSTHLDDIYYIYRWGQGAVYHLSGSGLQEEAWLAAAASKHMSPFWKTGEIVLKPYWEKPFPAMARAVLAARYTDKSVQEKP